MRAANSSTLTDGTVTNNVTVEGTGISFDCGPGQSVLDAAETAGWAMPYSCRRGFCHSCIGTVIAGSVRGGPGTRLAPDEALLCQVTADGPVRIRPRRIVPAGPVTRRSLTARVYRTRRPAHDVVVLELRFPIGRRIPFRAGQHLHVRLPGGKTRQYSMANPPRDNDMVELHVRIHPDGAFSGHIAPNLQPGDLLEIEMPHGDATVEPGAEPLLLLATGTGFAPIRSMIMDQHVRRAPRPTTVYWGGRRQPDLYHLDELLRWSAALPWLAVRPVLSRPPPGWEGMTGHVQDVAAQHHPDLSRHVVYACGSPAMVRSARALLTGTAGLPATAFVAEAFVSEPEAPATD